MAARRDRRDGRLDAGAERRCCPRVSGSRADRPRAAGAERPSSALTVPAGTPSRSAPAPAPPPSSTGAPHRTALVVAELRGERAVFLGGRCARRSSVHVAASRGGQRGLVSFSQATWRALGTTAHLVAADEELEAIRDAVEVELAGIDASCSRFRADAELVALNSAGGRPTRVSPLLLEAITVALRAAWVTDGEVDPTIGTAIAVAGYDRDFASVAPDGPPVSPVAAPGWRCVEVDASTNTVRVPDGVQLDLGATAKALAADRAVAATRSATSAGVLLSLGGDIAVAGPAPTGGWPVALADDHRSPATGPVVTLVSGGLATSSTTVRRWRRGGRELNHILDPSTGAPCRPVWRTVSVTAGSCVEANVASTAAIVLADRGPGWLRDSGLSARLVGVDGRVLLVNGWPEAQAA